MKKSTKNKKAGETAKQVRKAKKVAVKAAAPARRVVRSKSVLKKGTPQKRKKAARSRTATQATESKQKAKKRRQQTAGSSETRQGAGSPTMRRAIKKAQNKRSSRKLSKKPVAKKRSKRKSSDQQAGVRKAARRSITSHIKIKIVGVGGGGGNAITRMRRHFSVRGVEFIAVNTDIQDLDACDASKKLHIGRALTHGMGAGMDPEIGQRAAEENRAEIADAIKGADMVFLTAGFGGGTGTGASPVIAEIARELGILTVAIVTKPFAFEGTARAQIAEEGLAKIKDRVDTLLTIPNDRIFSIIDKNTSVLKAFEKIDDILQSAVQGVAEVVSASGLVNVDFADVKAVMSDVGLAVIGVGVGSGSERAVKAVNQAIHSPLLDISIEGARSVLFAVGGRSDLKLSEINEAAKIITESVDPGAKIIFGAYNDRKLRVGELKIVLIAAGFNGMAQRRGPDSLTLFAQNDENGLEEEKSVGGSKKEMQKDSGGESRFQKPDQGVAQGGEDLWDIPTFLRKRGKQR